MEEYLPGIKHIVYLMLENRSLDNVLGYLYDNNEQDKPLKFIGGSSPYNGLYSGNYWNYNEKEHKIYVSKIQPSDGQYIPDVDPGEIYLDVKQQISEDNGNKMSGFLKNFQKTATKHPERIMQAYTPDSLPVINSLAKKFAVSDAYYCSVPSNTDANRAFALTGNSIGTYGDQKDTAMVNTMLYYNPLTDFPPYPFSRKSIWDVLYDNGYTKNEDWMIFYSQLWPELPHFPGSKCYTELMLDSLQTCHMQGKFDTISTFYELLRGKGGILPKFSYLEPRWCLYFNYKDKNIANVNGNDYHPPANLGCGEEFLHTLFNELQSSEKYWDNTLLIINFDEHGGTYDHVEPPTTNIMSPWADQADGTKPPAHYEQDNPRYNFDSLGVRVPLILVSPLIEEKTVIRSGKSVPFDHTSIIATILKFFSIPKENWQLGSRTNNAPCLEKVITLKTPRNNITIDKPLHKCNPLSPTSNLANDLAISIMQRALALKAKELNFPYSKLIGLLQEHFSDITTITQMHEKSETILTQMHSESPG